MTLVMTLCRLRNMSYYVKFLLFSKKTVRIQDNYQYYSFRSVWNNALDLPVRRRFKTDVFTERVALNNPSYSRRYDMNFERKI